MGLPNLGHAVIINNLATAVPDTVQYSGGSRIFPRGGREPSRGGVNTPNFPENCMKSKEFGRPGGGVRPSRPPLDPPMQYVETFTTTLTKIGFKVNQYKDMNFQVTFKSVDRHAVALPNAFSLRT